MWHLHRFTSDGLAEAIKFFQLSRQRDPALSAPLSMMAYARMVESLFGWRESAQALNETYRLALEARDQDQVDPWALAMLGAASAMLGQHEAAIEATEEAVKFNPSFAVGFNGLAFARLLNGEPAKAVAAIERSLRLSPNDFFLSMWLSTLSTSHYMEGNYQSAHEIACRAIEHSPDYPMGHRSLASALGQLGLAEEGRQALSKYLELAPTYCTEVARRTMRFRKEHDFERYMDGLRRLGWDQ